MARQAAGWAALVVAAALVLAPSAAQASHQPTVSLGVPSVHQSTSKSLAHVKSATAISDPPANEDPSSAFEADCYPAQTTAGKKTACDKAALADFDKARAAEGMGPMTLPTTFDSLTQAQQLLVLANIERVDRGLLPVAGLTSALDSLANQGATTDDDPPFPDPFDGSYGTGNWAGAGASTLFDEYLWEYDDGLGSGNLDCTASDTSGCWGHRHDTLYSFASPLVMGAAAVTDQNYGESMAEEFIGGYSKTASDPVIAPTWATEATYIPLGVGTSSLTVGPDASATVEVWASGEDMPLTYSITNGSSAWSVSAGSCPATLPAGSSCTLSVTNTDPTAGSDSGTLSVSGPHGGGSVALSGSGAGPTTTPSPSPSPTPAVSLHASHSSVSYGTPVTFSGSVRSGGDGVAAHSVTLQREPAGTSVWTTVASGTTAGDGTVSASVTPNRTASYRLVSDASGGWPTATSAPVSVAVTSVLTLTASHHTVKHGKKVTLHGKVRPNQAGHAVRLQRRIAGHWKTVSIATLSSKSTVVIAFIDPNRGVVRFRLLARSSRSQLGAHSPVLKVSVT